MRSSSRSPTSLAALLGLACIGLRCAPGAPVPPHATPLCTTQGELRASPDGRLFVESAGFRAIAPGSDGLRAALHFEIRGRVKTPRALASGALREQLGLKLQALDACNLVTVMWRADRTAPLLVSVKRNPGLSASSACGARGYVRAAPSQARSLAPPAPGEPHTLEAEVANGALRVRVDGALAWEGALPAAAQGLAGPAGMRSDNLRWSGRFDAARAPGAAALCP